MPDSRTFPLTGVRLWKLSKKPQANLRRALRSHRLSHSNRRRDKKNEPRASQSSKSRNISWPRHEQDSSRASGRRGWRLIDYAVRWIRRTSGQRIAQTVRVFVAVRVPLFFLHAHWMLFLDPGASRHRFG